MTEQTAPAIIRAARVEVGLTQQQLGEHIGYTGRTAELTIQSIESGRRKIPRDKIKPIAESLGIDPLKIL